MKGAALAVVLATAAAGSTATYVDPAGDATLAPDITAVAISNDDAGTVAIRVSARGGGAGAAVSEIGFGVDVDQNPDTGALYYGAEFAMTLEALEPTFFRVAANGEFTEAPKPPSFAATYSGGIATFTFKGSEVGITPASGFNLFAIGYAAGDVDTAPDIRTFNYQLVSGTHAPELGPDTRAPVAMAQPASGVHGRRVELVYFSSEGRGETAETIRIYRAKKLLKTISTGLSDTNPFFGSFVTWKVPKKVHGRLRFCVSSVDRAGNKSNLSCARLMIK